MKLKVHNLGPIKKGEVDISKRFMMFVGYNSSGKTYVSKLIWHLYDRLTSHFGRGSSGDFDKKELVKIKSGEYHLSLEKIKTVFYQNHAPYALRETFRYFLKKERDSDLLKDLKILIDFNADFYEKIKETERKVFLGYRAEGINQHVEFIKVEDSTTIQIVNRKVDDNTWGILSEENRYKNFDIYATYENLISDELLLFEFDKFILSLIYENGIGRQFLLSAERVFLSVFYKDVLSAKISEAKSGKYTKDLEYLLNGFLKLDDANKISEYDDLVGMLDEITAGKYIVKNSDTIAPPNIKFQLESNQELEMHVASSTVNQLTTLYLYFQYWAKPANNFLIIDEPEIHLHPKNQLLLLDILFKFANRNNNKVLITTHSPLIADRVNNHLHLGYINDHDIPLENKDRFNFTPISHEDMGIYFFNGDKIENYEIGDYGSYFGDFSKVEKQVRDDGNDLAGTIYDFQACPPDLRPKFEKL